METEKTVKPQKGKDRWDKIQILLGPVGGLITAITITVISIFASGYLGRNQEQDTRTRLYTELMSKREDAESSIRKDMFNSIMGNLLKDSSTMDEKILQLELLAYNFHESLNLMPLFEYLDRRIDYIYKVKRITYETEREFKERLIKMSKDIINKQITSLEAVAKPVTFVYKDSAYKDDSSPVNAFTSYDTIPECSYFTFHDTIRADGFLTPVKQIVRIAVLSYDTAKVSVKVRLTIQTSIQGQVDRFHTPEFSVNYFEFPMIDNTRLENDMRLAVVLTCFNFDCMETTLNDEGTQCLNPNMHHRFEFKVMYFPGSYSSMKEKPYFDDIIRKLVKNK